MRRRLEHRLAAATLLLIAAVSPLAGQTLRGTVVLPDSTTPVTGAIVTAVDDRGATAARALTTVRGEFTLRLPSEGRYALIVQRIGFRPTRVPSIAVGASATETIRIVFAGAAVTLATMNVRERETCRVSADTGLAVARVWEEARKAMLSSQLSAEGHRSSRSGSSTIARSTPPRATCGSSASVARATRRRTRFVSPPIGTLDSAGYIVTDSTRNDILPARR